MNVDLHIHTTASDGSWTPQQLVCELQRSKIGFFAITDHDSIANVLATEQLARAVGLLFLAGVEISATMAGKSVHILGYGIDPRSQSLQNLLRHNTQLLEAADDDTVRKLIKEGFPIDYDEYCTYRHEPARGGWKSLNYLVDKGLCRNVDDFFSRVFTAERGIGFPSFPSPAEIIGIIQAAGGVAVLAHPGSAFHGTILEESLDDFAREDIGGVECFHPSQDAATTRRALAWCNRHGKLITGGSDCHGSFVEQRRLGHPPITLAELRLGRLMEKVHTPLCK